MEGFGALLGALFITRFAFRAIFFRLYLGGTILYLTGTAYLALLTFVAGGPNHSFYASSAALTIIGTAGACFAAMSSHNFVKISILLAGSSAFENSASQSTH